MDVKCFPISTIQGTERKKMKRDAFMMQGRYLATTENIFLRFW
jgi:hypothetical protein